MWIDGVWSNDRTGYDRLMTLPLTGWSWEYARRSPRLISAARATRRHGRAHVYKRGRGEVIRLRRRCPEAEAFGLQYFPDPALSAFETVAFWLPEVISTSLEGAVEHDAETQRGAPPLRLDRLSGSRHYLIGPGRRPKLVITARGYAAYIALNDDMLPAPQAAFLSLRLGSDRLGARNLHPVSAFAAFCEGAQPPARRVRGLSPEKLRDAMIALDGELADVPRREIAAALYGETRAENDWDNGDETMKKRVKRLVEKGFDLMNFGYRNLL